MPSRSEVCSLFIGCFALGACGSDATGAAEVVHPTAVNVTPTEFLGGAPCGLGAGSAELYLATVYDLSERGAGFERGFPLPSSELVPCMQSAGFVRVVAGHWYAASVQVFDRGSIEPAGPGLPLVVDTASGARVEPRWTTNCGFPDETLDAPTTDDYIDAGAAFAVLRNSVAVRGCAPLTDDAPGEATILVPLERLRGAIDCGDGMDAIDHFEVTLDGETRAVDCGEDVTFAGVRPNRSYAIDVMAFSAGSSAPSWGARCAVSARSSIVTQAECSALSDRGSVEVDVPGLLMTTDETCGGSVNRITVTLTVDDVERTLPADPTACDRPVRFDDLRAGGYSIRVSTELFDGEAGPAFDCTVEAVLGDVVSAECTPS
ncbi:MAG TPA: hypothetical protein VF989_07195 [Polyangiaceae bacterium]